MAIVIIGTNVTDDDAQMEPDEIAQVLSAMKRVQSPDIPDEVTAGPGLT